MPAKNKLPYIIISLLLLIFVLYHQEQKQSYVSKVILQPSQIYPAIPETENQVKIKDEKIGTGEEKQRIAITNGITKEMLTYKHWSGSYAPTAFVITIAGNQIAYNETMQIDVVSQETIVIRYDYSFVNGYKTGSREIEFVISPEKSDYVLRFAWKEPAHLVLENASIKNATVVPFNKSLESKRV